MFTRSSDRHCPRIGGLGGLQASRFGPQLQRACNTVEVTDACRKTAWRTHPCADDAVDIGGPYGARARPTLELVLHVCCTSGTRTDLIQIGDRV